MAKRGLGGLLVFAAVSGAVAAGVSYILQYKSYHKDLEKEFHDFENEDSEEITPNRNYVALHANKEDFLLAAKDTAQAALGMAGAAKEMLKDVKNIITDSMQTKVATDTSTITVEESEDFFDDAKETVEEVKESLDTVSEDN